MQRIRIPVEAKSSDKTKSNETGDEGFPLLAGTSGYNQLLVDHSIVSSVEEMGN